MEPSRMALVAGIFLTLAYPSPAQLSTLSLISPGSVWNYLDNGTDQGTAWQSPGFDDSAWAVGEAQLGYGDGDESTVVSFGPDPNFKYITTYFRRAFTVADPAAFSALTVRLLRDDGGVVYLNGVEIFRSNMPFGFFDYQSPAATTIPNSDESRFFSNAVDPSLLVSGVNVLAVEIHQANRTSSDISFDLELLGTVASGPPVIARQPARQIVAEGATAIFRVVVTGEPPLSYQWDINGLDLLGATNATLRLNGVTSEDEGNYRVTIRNALGSIVSAKAKLTVVNLAGDTFQIVALTTNSAAATEHLSLTGDDRGGLALSFNEVFVTGDASTARFNLGDLSDATGVGRVYDSLVSDLKTGKIYALANGTTLLPDTFVVNALIEVDGGTGTLTSNSIPLSVDVNLNGPYGSIGIFSGFGRIALHNGTRLFSILLPSGEVQDLGPVVVPSHGFSENWAYWGVAEYFNNTTWIAYARDSQTIVRTRAPDGLTLPVSAFQNLSDMASWSVSPVLNRWYFHHQGASQFRVGNETVGYAAATLAFAAQPQPPSIAAQPRSRAVREGRDTQFEVVALGYPLSYQWQFNGQDIVDATNSTLNLTAVTMNQNGIYSVSVSNALGRVVSSNALLSVASPGSASAFVAVFGAPNADSWNEDVRKKIENSGLFATVDGFLIQGGRPGPTLQDLEMYGAVLVYSDASFSDPQALGNALADYVDEGGGVVVATFALASGNLGGRLVAGGYLPFTTGSQGQPGGLTLVPEDPSHPILDGVNSFNGGGSSFHNTPLTITAGAELVARWSNGQPLVGVKPSLAGQVVCLNFYPPSSDARSDFWDARTDGGQLMANALLWAGGGSSQVAPPGIRTQPTNQTVLEGLDGRLRVGATGSRPLAFQWFFNDVPIANATNQTLLLTNVTLGQSGGYQVVITNLYGALTSQVATLTVQETRGIVGYFTDFNVPFTGPEQPILSTQHTPLRIDDISTFDFSRVSLLLIDETSDSPSPELLQRLSALQDWVVNGGKLIVHQRYFNPAIAFSNPFLLGARETRVTNFTFFINDINIIPPGNTLVTAGPHGILNNTSLDDGEFALQGFAVGQTLPRGSAALLSAGADTNQVLALAYGLGAGLVYYATLPLDFYLDFSSSPVGLAIRNVYAPNVIEYVSAFQPSGPPVIFDGPYSVVAPVGSTASLFLSARGQAPLQFQWLFNDVPLPGATNNPLRLSNVSSNDAGRYSVVVTNDLGRAISSNALLVVVPQVYVGVFDDPRFVDTTSGGPNATSDNVQATLRQLGYVAQPFTTFRSALTNDVLLFPFFANSPLGPQLDPSARAALQAYVLQGGLIIVQGGYPNLDFINSLFGTFLTANGGAPPQFYRSAQAAGTPFADNPPQISVNNYTIPPDTLSLPPGSLSIYTNFSQTVLALIPYGGGGIVYMGWNWFDAAPNGRQDGGWVQVLGSAVHARGGASSPPLISTLLLPTGSIWRYLDDGSNQGTAWRGRNFDDSAWLAGPAQLGYGDGDEATVTGYGPDPNNKFITSYFRRFFTVANAAQATNLTLRLLRDDGAAVYLNGVEIFRSNLPDGPISFNTLAPITVGGLDENLFLSTSVDPGALVDGTNLLAVEIHQANATSSDISFDLELSGAVLATIPLIGTQPISQTIPANTTLLLSAVAAGEPPLSYQWRFNEQDLPGATNAILLLNQVTTNQSGSYSLLVSNALGSTLSSNAIVRVVFLGEDTFRIADLSTNNASLIQDYPFAGDTRGGIAVSDRQVFYSGDAGTARFDLVDLSGGTNLGQIYDALISDLKTERIYTLGNETQIFTSDGGLVTTLLELDGLTAQPTGASIRLSQPIDLRNRYGEVGLFAGLGRIGVIDGRHAWSIELPSGLVLDLGEFSPLTHAYNENWAYWGLAEFFGGSIWFVYVRDFQTIVRTRVSDGVTETVARFNNLGSVASITVSLPFNRWYFHHRDFSQFSSFYQELGFADATFVSSAPALAPTIVRQPTGQTIAAGGTVSLRVVAKGTGPLRYQWLLEGTTLPGATNATLTLTQAMPGQSGNYTVRVGGPVDSALSSAALVSVVALGGETFQISRLSTNGARVVDHDALTGGARAGIAASAQEVFYSGNSSAARFDLADLSGGTSLGQTYDGLVSALGTETAYLLGNGTNSISFDQRVVTTLLELNGRTGELTGAGIPLTQSIDLGNNSGQVGIFAGLGRIVLTDGAQGWMIELPAGRVVGLGPMTVPAHLSTASGAYWGVAEFFGGSIWLVYVRDSQTIVRTRVPDGITETLAGFANLSDMAAITVSVPFNRWYFHHQFASQFSGFFQTLGFADASFLSSAPPLSPAIAKDPANQSIGAGGTVGFNVVARGTGPLRYQWLFEGSPISGATNTTLNLGNVTTNQAGRYSVVVSNAVGMTNSAAATLRVIPSVTLAVFDDPAFVNTSGGQFAQSDSVQASLRRLGHRVTTFTSISQGAAGSAPLLFPACELGELSFALSTAARDALQSFVARGGVMIVHGVNNDFNRAARLINAAFDFSLQGSFLNAGSTRTVSAEGTAFAEDPDSIPWNNATLGLLTSSLPPGARSIYQAADQAAVAWCPFGSGKIIYLGWNWTDAVPLGGQDGGWLRVLESAVEETAPPSPRAPEILGQPQSRLAVAGTTAQFRVLAAGFPLTFQWLFNSQPLAGATNHVLQLSGVSSNQAGVYTVVVSNNLGSVTSTDARLTVLAPLTVGVFDDGQYVDTTSGGNSAESDNVQATLRQLGHAVRPFTSIASAVSNEVLLFPEFENGDPTVAFGTAGRAALQNFVQQGGLLIAQGHPSDAQLLNAVFGWSLSNFGYVGGLVFPRRAEAAGSSFADGPPSLSGNDATLPLSTASLPFGARNIYGDSNQCVVALISYGAGYVIYMAWDWWNAAPIGTQDGGWIQTLANAVISRSVLPSAAPVISLQPQDRTVLAGLDVTFTVGGFGSSPLQLQWFYNGQTLPGATNSTLTLLTVTTNQNGSYHVVITNPAGSATSQVARLVVHPSLGLVGYYTDFNSFSTDLAAPIEQAGYTPLQILNITTFDFSRLKMFMLVEANDSGVAQDLIARLPDIAAWVRDGGRLIVHDRYVTGGAPLSNPFLPAASGTVLVRAPADNVTILPPADNLVVAGTHGMLNNGSLDGANYSYHGYAERETLPARALPILGAGLDTNQVVAFSYGLGAGTIYYSAMPLDYLLNHGGPLGDTIRMIYLPNVLEHAAAFAVTGPPVVLTNPRNVTVLAGGAATLTVDFNGQSPLFYQWFFNGAPIPGATNAALLLTDVLTNQAGGYKLSLSNAVGAIIAPPVLLDVIQPTPFRIVSLTSNSAQVVDHNGITGDDRGGIAVSSTRVLYTGDSATGRFAAANLSGGTPLPQSYDALVSNLRTETIYTLVDHTFLISGGGGTVTALVQLDGNTGALTTNRIELSTSIPLSFDTGIFAGYDAVVLHTGGRVYRIALPSGYVVDLGFMGSFQHAGCENWAYWGVTEFFNGAVYLTYVRDFTTIARTRVPDGATTNLATFSNLNDMCSFTVSVPRGRWYFHYEGSAQFGGTEETLGFAAATFDRSPRLLTALTNQVISEDSSVGPIPFSIQEFETTPTQVVFAVTSSNPGLLPQSNILIGGSVFNRTLTLTPAPNQFGTSVVTLAVIDSIGQSTNQSFTLTVDPVNDAPSFTKGPDVFGREDAGPQSVSAWASNITPGPGNEAEQTVNFRVSHDNPGLFTSPPALSAGGTLTFTPAPNANGAALVTVILQDDGGTANGGTDASEAAQFTITVTAVNDPPSFTKGPDQLVFEDSGPRVVAGWAASISAGPADEAGQALSFAVSNDTPTLFSAQPGLDAAGTLTFTPAPDANGTALVTVRLQDNGGAEAGGLDTSGAQTFTITVLPVNDPPVFTKGPDQVVDEDAGLQRAAGWAAALSLGPPDEFLQLPTFHTSNDNPAVFSLQPTVSASGELRFQPAPDVHGQATVTVILSDDGGTANGGRDSGTPQTFTISVNSVNDAPSFTPGPGQIVDENSVPVSIPNWATDLSPGPADEADQTLAFLVSNDRSSLFSAQPAISPDGTLTFTPATNAVGSAIVTVRLKDNGGTEHGGTDTSPAQNFMITLRAMNHAPVANAQAVSLNENTPASIRLTGSDEDGDALVYTILTLPAHGTLDGSGANRTYAPADKYTGPDSFTFKVSDGRLDSLAATVSLTVLPVNLAPVAVAQVSPLFALRPENTNTMILSPNNTNAQVVLDASLSHDAENDPLHYSWFGDGLLVPFGSGAVLSNVFEVGSHTITLVVDDSQLSGSDTLNLEIIRPGEAIDEIIALLNESNLERKRKRPLLATLKAAVASFDRGSFTSGRNQLHAFENKVRAQIASADPVLADSLIQAAQNVLRIVSRKE